MHENIVCTIFTHTHTHFCIFQSSRWLQYPPLFINHWVDACFLFAFKGVKQENSPNASDSTRKTLRFGVSEVTGVFVLEQGLYYSSSETCPRQRACTSLTWEHCTGSFACHLPTSLTFFFSSFPSLPCLALPPCLFWACGSRNELSVWKALVKLIFAWPVSWCVYKLLSGEITHHSPEPWVCSFLGLSWKALYSSLNDHQLPALVQCAEFDWLATLAQNKFIFIFI